MRGMLRNGEFKGAAAAMLALFAAAAAILCVLCARQVNALHARFADQSAALVGKAVSAQPELEGEFIQALLSPASPEDIEKGRAALAAYGYSASSPAATDPMLSGALPGTVWAALLFMAAFAAAALGLLAHGYANVYGKVRRIAGAAERVVDGDFSATLPAGFEGDFEILGHRFNQMANRLQRNVERLTEEKVFLKNVISDISHQLKTPLATLVVYNDLMREDAGMDEARRADFLELGRQQLQRLEWLIQSLLKTARLEAGSVAFRHDKATLGSVAHTAAATLKTVAEETGVAVTVRELHEGAEFTGDAEWLAEALINVVKNGIEHSASGGTVEISTDQTPLTSSIIVADRGEGIAAADLPRIFDRFYRSTAGVRPNSIGIGLAMAKAIVEGQGGSITVKSEKGKGSEFTITFLRTLGE
jgi:signal transduction histidine kinase